MDLTADPCEDFFQFACGTWNRKHIIPEDRSSVSTFEVLADDLQIVLKGLRYAFNLNVFNSNFCYSEGICLFKRAIVSYIR